MKRAYLFLADNDYGRIEAELNMFVGPFVFGRDLRANHISYLQWDLHGLKLVDKAEDSVWDAYHFMKSAQYFPSRAFLVVDRFTWEMFDTFSSNMILMDQPNWPNLVLNQLETK